MIARLLHWLTGYLPLRIIQSQAGKPYLERYYLGALLGCRSYIHRFVASDPDGFGLHDHPWGWAFSIVLSGWYLEDRRTGLHAVCFFNWIPGDKFHRVILPPEQRECWTLFVHGPRRKPWGFLKATNPGGAILMWRPRESPDGEVTGWWKQTGQGRFNPQRTVAGNCSQPQE